jgi:hypothetical protein
MEQERLSNLHPRREFVKKNLPLICTIFALAGGIFAWWIDSRNDEPQAAVLAILVVTFGLGFVIPRRAWLWALLCGICLPIGYLIARSLGFYPVAPLEPGWYASILALIPAFIGAYFGALGRVMLNTAFAKP